MSSIFLKNETSICRFEINELLFIKCDDHCLSFHSADKVFHSTGCLCEVIKTLPNYFVLINRNTVINIKLINEIKLCQRKIILQNGTEHIISHRKMSFLMKFICFPNSKLIIHTLDEELNTLTKTK